MGKMKEIEVLAIGDTGFEPCVEFTESGSLPVATLEEFINSRWIGQQDVEVQGVKVYGIISQLTFKEIK